MFNAPWPGFAKAVGGLGIGVGFGYLFFTLASLETRSRSAGTDWVVFAGRRRSLLFVGG